ncbi:BamA/TamA family outer membrane protein [Nibrella viscosa]|uniref:BamA/TamA family outer membrane protein n=1 Tax=Nibrella viscosa TaxID=1084524 RepID=A0ABP8KHV9_9BACT
MLLLPDTGFSQLADSLTRRFSVLPLPVVYYTPETRLAYGAAATATFRFRRDSLTARPSQLTLGAAYTQNKQFLVYLPFQLFYRNNRYYANGEAGYYRYNYFFFGFGQRTVPAELYGVNFPRIRLNVFRRVANRLYAGVRYQYEDYQVTDVVPNGLLVSGDVPGGRGSRLSGAGLGLFYDTRDNVFFPTKGVVVDLAYLTHGYGLGSTVRFDRWQADISSYHTVSRWAILAVNYFSSFTTGQAPFNAMALLGGGKRGRGYYEGQFRDQHLALLQTELRLNIWRRLGGVVFSSVGVLGNEQRLFRLNDSKGAYGAGLRFTVNRREHLNLRLDYARGHQSSGFYFTVGEAF